MTQPDLARIRRGIERTTWWVRNPPRTTRGAKVDAGGKPAVRVTTPLSRPDHHILYLHGGAYIYGSPLLYRDLSWRIADAARAVVWMLDYRLAPEHPFPAALDDAACAYRWLLAQGADPRRIAVMGDSAGGGLTFGTLLKLRDEGEPMPAAAAGLSPWTDLTITSASSRLFAKTDPMLNLGDAKHYVAWYLGDADRRNPYASPVFGDPAGLPPSLIQAGDDEMLRDDAVTHGGTAASGRRPGRAGALAAHAARLAHAGARGAGGSAGDRADRRICAAAMGTKHAMTTP